LSFGRLSSPAKRGRGTVRRTVVWARGAASRRLATGGRVTPDVFDPEALADGMAPLLGLTQTPESRAQTIVHLRIAAEQARKLLAVSVGDHEEPAPVFAP